MDTIKEIILDILKNIWSMFLYILVILVIAFFMFGNFGSPMGRYTDFGDNYL